MSLFDKQSLAILSVAHGAVLSIKNNYNLGPSFLSKVADADLLFKEAGQQWPTKSDQGVTTWMLEKLNKWAAKERAVNGSWEVLGLAAVAMQALTDLDERVSFKARRQGGMHIEQAELLGPIFPAVQEIMDEIDPRGTRFDLYQSSDRMLKELYSIIEWA